MFFAEGDCISLLTYTLNDQGEIARAGEREWATIHTLEKIPPRFLGNYSKAFTVVDTEGSRRRQLHLVLKAESRAIETYRKYLSLQIAGVPVVDDFRLVDETTIAMTDMRAEGTWLFGKAMKTMMKRAVTRDDYHDAARAYLRAIPGEIYDSFLAETQDMDMVKDTLDRYAQNATHAGISLPAGEEGFELGVNGIYNRFLFLDLSWVQLNQQPLEAAERNGRVVAETLRDIVEMRNWLAIHRPQGVIQFSDETSGS